MISSPCNVQSKRQKPRQSSVRQAWQKTNTTAAAAAPKKRRGSKNLLYANKNDARAQERFVSRFPGFSSLAAALSSLQQQRQALAICSKKLTPKPKSAEKERQALTRQREQAQKKRQHFMKLYEVSRLNVKPARRRSHTDKGTRIFLGSG